MTPSINKALQNTVIADKKISKVYFDDNGNHYFNVHRLPVSKEDKDPDEYKLYGSGLYSHSQVIPGIFNTEGKKEIIAKGDQTTLINESLTITRDEVISFKVKPEGEGLVAKVANLSKEDRAALKALLASEDEDSE